MKRRQALLQASLALVATTHTRLWNNKINASQADRTMHTPNHLLSSSLFGYTPLDQILPIANRLGINSLDIWPKVHGNQREQLTLMGESKFNELLERHDCKLECLTQYPLGPFGLGDEMKLAQRLGCHTIVTGSGGPKGLKGQELKSSIRDFVEKLKPHLEIAQASQVTIAIENHSSSLIDSPDSIQWLCQMRPSDRLAIAFAPYHLPQDNTVLTKLLQDILPCVEVFYAWQHGKGCMQAQPKEDELLQLPGRGSLDFTPLLTLLKRNHYQRWLEVFMHPFPRGIPIAETPEQVFDLLKASKTHLDQIWQSIS